MTNEDINIYASKFTGDRNRRKLCGKNQPL